MASRTLMPLLRSVTAYLIRKINEHHAIIRQNGGEGLWVLIQVLLGIAGLIVAVFDGNSNAEGDFLSPVGTLNASQINAVQAIFAQFNAAVGED